MRTAKPCLGRVMTVTIADVANRLLALSAESGGRMNISFRESTRGFVAAATGSWPLRSRDADGAHRAIPTANRTVPKASVRKQWLGAPAAVDVVYCASYERRFG